MKYCYHLIVFRPSKFVRVDQVAVGVAVRHASGVDIRMPYQPKIAAIMPFFTRRMLEKTKESLMAIAEYNADYFMQELPHMQSFCAVDEHQGWFLAESKEDYEKSIQDILSQTVATPKVTSKRKVTSTKLVTEMKRVFKQKKILGQSLDDIHKHLVVPSFPISEDEGLHADFAYKNGVYHVTTVSDFRAESSSLKTKQAHAAIQAITMLEGRKKLEGKSYAVYAADAHSESNIQHILTMLDDYSCGNIYNFASDDDMNDYYQSIENHLSPQTCVTI